MAERSRLRSILILTAITIALVLASCQSGLQALHMEVNTVFANASNPFIASGPAVDAGLICPTGGVEEQGTPIQPDPEGSRFMIITVDKTLTCDDGSGIFYINMTVTVDTKGEAPSTAQWTLLRGTGKYANLKGSGTLIGVLSSDGSSIYDTYDGKVAIVSAPNP